MKQTKNSLMSIYFSINGRLSCSRYFSSLITILFVIVCINYLFSKRFGINIANLYFLLLNGVIEPITILLIIINSLFSYMFFVLGAKRLQDLGYNGYLYLVWIALQLFSTYLSTHIPYLKTILSMIGIVLFFVFILKKGTIGENKYGPDPIVQKEILKSGKSN